ncbi:hypothetical protein F4778DRAFT_711787 [Xylariomycetidae sp. FL2044]|nr:hypothetical protein F4778DRAFT_711787 [Xylariomycetidae sp. FL2044]
MSFPKAYTLNSYPGHHDKMTKEYLEASLNPEENVRQGTQNQNSSPADRWWSRLFSYLHNRLKLAVQWWYAKTESLKEKTVLPLSKEQWKENARLLEIWNLPHESPVNFTSLEVRTLNHDQRVIPGIGLTRWYKDSNYNTKSFYFEIEGNHSGTNRDSETFIYGTTEIIKETEIGILISSLCGADKFGRRRLCVTGHDIAHQLKSLKAYWAIPDDTIILDTQRIWREQHGETEFFSWNSVYARPSAKTKQPSVQMPEMLRISSYSYSELRERVRWNQRSKSQGKTPSKTNS